MGDSKTQDLIDSLVHFLDDYFMRTVVHSQYCNIEIVLY